MNAVVQFQPPRLPYHDAIEERFGVDKSAWKVLVEATFPSARTPDAIVMALGYCKARNLDIFKRPVHIVPMWDSKRQDYVETVWPGIAEFRTTAMRTGQYAGCEEVSFGPDVTVDFSWTDRKKGAMQATVTFPEWASMTVYRLVGNTRVAFPGPKTYWMETCATRGGLQVPNDMWVKRPRGQIEKCCEAAALRRAFPEELGSQYAAEEMEGRVIDGEVVAQTIGPNVQSLHADDDDLAVSRPEPKKRGPKPKAEKEPQDAPIEPEVTDVAQEAETPATEAQSEPDEVLDEDDLPEGLRARPTETASAPNADAGLGSSESAMPASIDSQEEASSHALSEPDVISVGYPDPDEVYHLNGDEWDENGRRDTYKNGLPFSSAKRETGHAIYEDHRPEGPVGMAIEPETEDAPRDELDVYVDAVEAAKTWQEIAEAMKTLWATDFFKGKTLDQQNHIRATTWDYVVELASRPDQADHPTAFRLWLETQDDADAINGTFMTLQRGTMWPKVAGPQQADITLAVKRRLEKIGG